eukprot:scaffold106361_cov66-Phaeocystis_antarctica.AAC.2
MNGSSAVPPTYRQVSASPYPQHQASAHSPATAWRSMKLLRVVERMGSDPESIAITCPRDKRPACAAVVFFAASAYPKLGAPNTTRCVLETREAACPARRSHFYLSVAGSQDYGKEVSEGHTSIQHWGRRRKLIGDMRSARCPLSAGARQPPMRPMSWYCGSLDTMQKEPLPCRHVMRSASGRKLLMASMIVCKEVARADHDALGVAG